MILGSLLKIWFLLLAGAWFPLGALAIPSADADAAPIAGFWDWFGSDKPKAAPVAPAPAPAAAPAPPAAPPAPSYQIQDIVPVTARPPSAADDTVYPNMMSDRKSSAPIISALIEFFSDEYRKASISIHFKVEDIGRCVQWVAKARNSATEKDILFDTGSNRLMWATKFSFDNNPSTFDERGHSWARNVAFFSDRYCRTMIGVQQMDHSGVLERPAMFSMQQADIRGDQGRANSVGIPRGHCTKTSTLGASTILVTETAVITTFITPTVTILATRTFSNTSISTVNEAPTETDTSFSFEITSFTTTIPTITVTGAPITVTASERINRKRFQARGYPLLDPDCSCFLTSTCTVTVTPDPGVTVVETTYTTTTTTEYKTITFNSTVSTTIVATTSTTTAIGNATVTFLTTEALTGSDISTVGSTTVTVQSTVTAPAVQLSSPTAIFGDPVEGSPRNYDDIWSLVTLPFPIEIYNVSSSRIYVSVNGFISLDEEPGTSFINSQLPVADDVSGANRLPNTAAVALWDDLYIYAGTQQGVFYQIDGTTPGSRVLSFEFYTSAYRRSAEFFHFLIRYEEAKPNILTYKYLEVFGGGVSATIGAQSRSQNLWVQWSSDQADAVSNGQSLLVDTIANAITSI
ncbi:hypothetical protein TWF106_011051 [Orbilia oligospora]|uniref:Uncharacterized protein n=1 Tax=Orbilia oligospora TaxID=2813651 RepID=A0A7C8UCE7_ORBOL|nr:hypothetical protein TWF106_011051 [Orbilia oligospora]